MWLNRNLSGQRVFASGSTQFWLNAFGETSEVSGGFDNGVVNQVVRTASYIIRTGDGAGDRDAEISLLWLKAMGVHAVIVQGADSTEAYHDDRNPKKFEGVLPALWHEGGDTIYAVPQRSPSLARVMARSDLVLRTPANGIDIQALRTYVSALEDPTLPESESHWITRHSLVVHASLTPEQLVSLQISYHSGWHATVNGVDHPLAEDGLGLMYIEPNCNGDCRIELGYDGGREMRIARWAAMTSWIFVVFLLFGRTVAVKVRRAAMRIHQGRR
jgi:hypothetical protein